MESITNGAAGQIPAPERWCGDCGEALGDAAHLHDGDLVCPPCWFAVRLAEEREHLEEAEAEVESVRAELEELEATFEREVAELRTRKVTWMRRVGDADRRVKALEAEALAAAEELATPAPDPLEGLIPIVPIGGGAPFEPTEADLADYREWAEALDRRLAEEEMEHREPEAPFGYE